MSLPGTHRLLPRQLKICCNNFYKCDTIDKDERNIALTESNRKGYIMKLSKGLTLMELIVVFIIIVLIMVFLMPIHYGTRSRELAKRVQCQSNLSAIGRSIAMYQNEFNDKLPRPWIENNGSFGSGLYNKTDEYKITRFLNLDWNDYENVQTVGLCLYLLVKNEGTDPKSFLCPSAQNDEEMSLEAISNWAWKNREWKIEFWRDMNDFKSLYNLSYSYHDPWSTYELQIDSPLIADKSNAYDTEIGVRNSLAGDFPIQNQDETWVDNGKNPQHGNSKNHNGECQNVLYMNSSVKRGFTPLMGIGGENIYTYWSGDQTTDRYKFIGRWNKGHSQARSDSYLGN